MSEKRSTFRNLIIIILVLSAGTFVLYSLFLPKNKEKRIVAIPEETIQASKKELPKPVKVKTGKETEKSINKKNVPINISAKPETVTEKMESVESLCKKGWQLLDKGNTAQAIATFKKAASIRRSSPDAHLGLGESFNAAGNKNEAVKHYKKYLELKPDAEDRLEIEAILNDL